MSEANKESTGAVHSDIHYGVARKKGTHVIAAAANNPKAPCNQPFHKPGSKKASEAYS